MNNVMLIGRYHSLEKVNESEFIFTIIISNEDGDLTLPIYVNNIIADKINHYCQENDLFGVKAILDIYDNEICIIASKVSFIAK